MEEVSKIFDLNPTLFSEKIERVWTCKDGPARAYFEWTSSTLAPGFQVGRTMYRSYYVNGISIDTLDFGRVEPPTQRLEGAVAWFNRMVNESAQHEGATPKTHDLYWRTRPETQSDRSGLVWKFYARFGFAPKDAEILPEET